MASKSGGSKTARRSNPMMAAKGFIADVSATRVVSLNGGKFAYVYDGAGRLTQMATDSEEFSTAVAALVSAFGAPRIERELAELAAANPAWVQTVSRLRDQGVFQPA